MCGVMPKVPAVTIHTAQLWALLSSLVYVPPQKLPEQQWFCPAEWEGKFFIKYFPSWSFETLLVPE